MPIFDKRKDNLYGGKQVKSFVQLQSEVETSGEFRPQGENLPKRAFLIGLFSSTTWQEFGQNNQ